MVRVETKALEVEGVVERPAEAASVTVREKDLVTEVATAQLVGLLVSRLT